MAGSSAVTCCRCASKSPPFKSLLILQPILLEGARGLHMLDATGLRVNHWPDRCTCLCQGLWRSMRSRH